VKVVSQRKTPAVDHHHPLRALAPLGLADRGAPFLAGAKLPSINDSLHLICWRSFNSPRKERVGWIFTWAAAAYNLVRMRNLLGSTA
jgi:hypothetical protein